MGPLLVFAFATVVGLLYAWAAYVGKLPRFITAIAVFFAIYDGTALLLDAFISWVSP